MGCKCGSQSGQIRVARSGGSSGPVVSQAAAAPVPAAKTTKIVVERPHKSRVLTTGVRSARDVDRHRDQ